MEAVVPPRTRGGGGDGEGGGGDGEGGGGEGEESFDESVTSISATKIRKKMGLK